MNNILSLGSKAGIEWDGMINAIVNLKGAIKGC
jgi:hypothetical protein